MKLKELIQWKYESEIQHAVPYFFIFVHFYFSIARFRLVQMHINPMNENVVAKNIQIPNFRQFSKNNYSMENRTNFIQELLAMQIWARLYSVHITLSAAVVSVPTMVRIVKETSAKVVEKQRNCI